MRPLAGKDAQALDLLMQAAAIGRHRKSFTVADLIRVAHEHLDLGHLCDRRLAAEQRRADEAEAENGQLRERVDWLVRELAAHMDNDEGLPPLKTVEVTRGEFESFALYCEGRQRQDIAAELGIDKRTVTNYVSRVADLIDAPPSTAAALVNRGVVSIRPKQPKTRGKRAA